MTLIYPLDNLYAQDQRKKHFVSVRMEQELFKELMEKAQAQGKDLSCTIRELCKSGLNNNENTPGI